MTINASAEFLREMIDALPALVWVCDVDGHCSTVSARWTAYTGQPSSALLGDGWWAAIHPADAETTRARWSAATKGREAFELEFRLRRSDGTWRLFKARAAPSVTADVKPGQWLVNGTDVEDLRAVAHNTVLHNELESSVAARTQDLQQANDQLQILSLQLRTAQRMTRVGSWQLDIGSGDPVWSDELFLIFRMDKAGGPPNYKVQRRMFDTSSWTRLSAAIDRSVATGEGYELSLGIVRSDGERGTAIARAETVVDDDGKVVQLVGTFQDVSERERINQQLRQLTERMQLATSAARMGVWDWDVTANTLIWDDAMYALFGTSPEASSPSYELWHAALHSEDRECTVLALRDAVGGGRPFDTSFRIVTGDGDTRHLRAAALVHDEITGKRVVGVNWDITRERRAELALQRSEALGRAVVDHAGPALIATDLVGTITLFNKAAEALLGHRSAELIGWATPLLFHDSEEIEARRLVLEQELQAQVDTTFDVFVALVRARGIDVNEWTYVCRSGARVPVLLTVTALRNDRNDVIGYLGVAVDLTARKQEEHKLRELNVLLAQRSAQTEVLLQEVHHRVKNNLQVIASLMNMQIRKVKDEGARAALQDCRTRVDSIALIHEQLYQSKDYAKVPFAEYCKKMIENIFYASETAPERVSLAVDLQPVALTVDKAIPCGLVLNELITNALKHAFVDGRRGTVQVSLRQTDDGDAILVVADDGVGTTAPAAGRSTSMGTQLIHTLVKQLDGRLEVRNDGGTHTTVIFPIGAVVHG